jgi:hypothetical protein
MRKIDEREVVLRDLGFSKTRCGGLNDFYTIVDVSNLN